MGEAFSLKPPQGSWFFPELALHLPSMYSETPPSLAPSHHSTSRGKGGGSLRSREQPAGQAGVAVSRSHCRDHTYVLLATPATWAPWVLRSEDQHPIPLTSISTPVPFSDIWPHLSSRMVYKEEIIDRSHLGHIRCSVCARGT